MAVTYTWKVTSLKTRNEGQYENAVVQVYWQKTGVDENGNMGSFPGATPFTTSTMPEDKEFIPFADLTEEIVLEWIQAVVVGDYEKHVNGQIAKQIDEKVRPINEIRLPWSPVDTTANTAPVPTP